jgi:hypothetical protein
MDFHCELKGWDKITALLFFLSDDQNDGDRGDNFHSVLAAIQHTHGE